MLSAVRSLCVARLPKASVPVLPRIHSAIRCASSAPAVHGRKAMPHYMICPNCRREGHTKRQCTAPVAPCVACGELGHTRRDCPNPDQARIDAFHASPRKCFRCGEPGHVLKECPKPSKCFSCGQEGHLQKDCPTRPKPTLGFAA